MVRHDAKPPAGLDPALDNGILEWLEESDIEMAADQDEYLLIQRQGCYLCSIRYPVGRKRQLVG